MRSTTKTWIWLLSLEASFVLVTVGIVSLGHG